MKLLALQNWTNAKRRRISVEGEILVDEEIPPVEH